jgi:ABC-type uncharacterized transport system involved in gliding motility auxiliary subunit
MQRALATNDERADDTSPGMDEIGRRTRPKPREQRIIIIGDGDFLSNAYLGRGSNLTLALNIFNWLANDETLIDIPVRSAPDQDFELSRASAALIRIGAMFGLPALLLGTGFFIWHRRRRL